MHRVNCRSFQSVTIWNTKICKLASTTIYSRVCEIKILLKSRGVINQRRNERGIPSSIEWHSFFFPLSFMSTVGQREKEEGYRGELQPRVDPSGTVETFAILVETFPFPGLLPPCPVNQPSEVDSVTDYTRDSRFVFRKRVAQRGICSEIPYHRCRNILNT